MDRSECEGCVTLMEIVKSIANRDDNFRNLYVALPMGVITDEMAKLKRAEARNADNKKQRRHTGP